MNSVTEEGVPPGKNTVPSVGARHDLYFHSLRRLVDCRLNTHLPARLSPTQRVESAMHYAVQGGHRWRPLLLIAAYQALTAKSALDVLDAACAIEIVHCGTIILDDLPCIDNNTELRRGRIPCHVVHGEAITIYASHLLYGLAERLSCDDAIRLQIQEKDIRHHFAALRERLVEAQVLELNLDTETVPADDAALTQFYELKSSPFVSAVWLAATLGKMEKQKRESLTRFGKYLGVAYQLADDLLDVEGEPCLMGKPGGKDRGKINSVTVAGTNYSRVLMRRFLGLAEKTLESITMDTAVLHRLMYDLVKPVL